MAKTDDLVVTIRTDDGKLTKGLNKANRNLNDFGNDAKKLVGIIGGAFAVKRVAEFTFEMVKLGGVTEGVLDAFTRIAETDTLKQLQGATKETVSELGLMKRAVTAQNLGVPVENLANLFEFATKRAQDTGEAVDFLVESIVLGIGRKSPLILDNLGISAIQLKEKLNGVSSQAASVAQVAAAVGEIAAESLKKSGGIIETNSIKVQQLQADWENFLGVLAADKGLKELSGKVLDGLRRQLELLPENLKTSRNALELIFGNRISKQRKAAIDELTNSVKKFLDKTKDAGKAVSEEGGKEIKTIISVAQKIQLLNTEVDKLQKTFTNPNIEFTAAQEAFKDAEKLKKEILDLKKILNFGKRVETPDEIQTRGDVPLISAVDIFTTKDTLEDMTDFQKGIMDKYRVMIQEIQDEVDTLNQDFNMSVVDGIVGGLEAAINGASFGGIMSALLTPMASILEQEGKILIAAGIGMEVFKKALSTLNGPAAIAAGIGLIAAAQGLKALGNIGGGGGGSAAAGGSAGGGSASSSASFGGGRRQGFDISGEFEVSGDNLKYVIDRANNNDNRTRTSGKNGN